MSESNRNTGKDSIMEAYYKMIGEAHIDNVVDELLSKADEIDKVMVPKSLDDWFDSYQKKREQKLNKIRWLKQMKKLSSRAAVFVMILITSATVVTLTVEAFRIRVFNFFLEKNETYSEIKFYEDETNQVAPDIKLDSYYYLSYLPSGYYYEKYLLVEDGVVINYTNGNESIIFDQATDGTNYQLDTEDAQVYEVAVGENSGQIIKKCGQIILIWYDNENVFLIRGQISEQEILKMAESLKKN